MKKSQNIFYEDDINSYLKIIDSKNQEHIFCFDKSFSPQIKKYHWVYLSCGTKFGYARTTINNKYILLHRFLFSLANHENIDNKQIDHKNGNTFDNTLKNLRICNSQENARNTIHRPTPQEGKTIGVRKDNRCKNSWRAQIYIDKNKKIEKTYKNKELAIIQRLIWEIIYFKEFAPQMDLIKNKYPYLLNYQSIPKEMTFSKNIELIKKIGERLLVDKHCPCSLIKDDSTICPCENCRIDYNCHCGIFQLKEKEEV